MGNDIKHFSINIIQLPLPIEVLKLRVLLMRLMLTAVPVAVFLDSARFGGLLYIPVFGIF